MATSVGRSLLAFSSPVYPRESGNHFGQGDIVASLVWIIVVVIIDGIGTFPAVKVGIDVQPPHEVSGNWLEGGAFDAVMTCTSAAGAARHGRPVAAVHLENDPGVLNISRRAEQEEVARGRFCPAGIGHPCLVSIHYEWP